MESWPKKQWEATKTAAKLDRFGGKLHIQAEKKMTLRPRGGTNTAGFTGSSMLCRLTA